MKPYVLFAVIIILTFSKEAGADYNRGAEAYNNKDYDIALLEFLPLAEAGDEAVQYLVGLVYQNQNNTHAAQSWFEKAAQKGNEKAMFALGILYANGGGVEQNDDMAIDWFEKAEAKGNKEALQNKKIILKNKAGKTFNNALIEYENKNYDEAKKGFLSAAVQGIAEANLNLAIMYAYGYGVVKDVKEAPCCWM